jgi:FlaA1/EpsC-like NDP-sugar epimerase
VRPVDRSSHTQRPSIPTRIVGRVRRDLPLMLLDALLVVPAYMIPLVLRYQGDVPYDAWRSFWIMMPVIVACHLLGNFWFGLYGQMWRYASVQEARRVLLAGFTSFVMVIGFVLLIDTHHRPVPLSVVCLGSAWSVLAFGAIRFQSRLFAFRRRSVDEDETRVVIMGAGDAGAQVFSDILRDEDLSMRVVAVVDDDPRNRGMALHGVAVMGGRESIPALVRDLDVDQVLLAIPTANSELIRQVATICETCGVSLRVLPSVREIVGGRVTANDLRDLQIEDLLGRQQVQTDLAAVHGMLRGRRVLITGAGGSIGSEIARQVQRFEPAALALLDNDETHLHDLLTTLEPAGTVSVLADVRDRARLAEVFSEERPEIVFHAAAHKHVPILEEYPQEAYATNVVGTANVVELAKANGAERFVMISTDKAVRASSVMGGSKRFAEEIVRSASGRGMASCAVRFGNVLGSRGSVVPTFLQQIAAGGPVTVTDPAMTRYFMSVEEAVQLVLQAASLADGGEIFTLEMGEPVNIMDLARRLIRLSGQVPGRDIALQIVGVRAGEKMHEELSDDGETPVPSGSAGIVVSTPAEPDTAVLRGRMREMGRMVVEGQRKELAEELRGGVEEQIPVAVGAGPTVEENAS